MTRRHNHQVTLASAAVKPLRCDHLTKPGQNGLAMTIMTAITISTVGTSLAIR
jgi:hypothetical protein